MMTPPTRQPEQLNGVAAITSPVMTALETAVYLRLCDQDATPDRRQSAIRTVHRLVQEGKLRAIQPGKEYVFWRQEVDAYVERETEAFKPRRRSSAGVDS